MEEANENRTTHATAANDTSSRSHAICQIHVKKGEEVLGKLVLVDLAGSERAQDTQSNNRQRRMEGAEINKRYNIFNIVYWHSRNASEPWMIRLIMSRFEHRSLRLSSGTPSLISCTQAR